MSDSPYKAMGEQSEDKNFFEKCSHDCYWCACDWNGNQWWACDMCEPCCGQPCNCLDACKCCCCWWLCGPCTLAKLYAYSVNQDCACLNHTLLAFFCGICVCIFTRHNLRRKENIGDVCEYWWGDALCVCCCPCCTLCQMVRATKMDDWDWLKGVQTRGFLCTEDPWRFWLPD